MIDRARRSGPAAVACALALGILVGERVRSLGELAAFLAAAAVGALALGTRSADVRYVLVLVAILLVGAGLMQRSLHRLRSWPLAHAVETRADGSLTATLVEDPDGTRFNTQALARVHHGRFGHGSRDGGGRLVLIAAEGDAAPRLGVLDAGDQVTVHGWLRPLEGFDLRYRWRHAVARFDANRLTDFRGPTAIAMRAANPIRSTVLRGTLALPPTERALVAGFLLGDTRALPDDVLERFRAAGLSHLLAVSGANVAFTLGLLGPALRRLRRGARLGATIAVLLVFGAMTRWEPSVLRACAMAGCAAVAVHAGRPARATRVLAVAVTVLLVLDPFLVHSIGFLLSCGASLGIALLSAPIAARLRGPAWFRESMGTTAAAQLGVAPVLLPVFGSIPLVALPANLLAVPIAGPLTMWGLVGGALAAMSASFVPGAGALIQLPTRLMADAMLGIADAAARVPIAISAPMAGVMGACVLLAVLGWRGRMLRRDDLVVPPW